MDTLKKQKNTNKDTDKIKDFIIPLIIASV